MISIYSTVLATFYLDRSANVLKDYVVIDLYSEGGM